MGLEKVFGLVPRKKVFGTILDKTFITVKGTLRDFVDYDDAWLLALAHEAKNVYDIGCNIGQTSLLMLCPGTIENIILVDPNPSALSMCAENLILNRLSHKARFICAFASQEADKIVDFFTVGTGAAGSMFKQHADTASDIGVSLQVPTTTLDSLYFQYGILPDLVKIDVEGAENLVLNGAQEIATKHKTRFFVEMHSNPELSMEDNATRVLEWCQAHSYMAWYLKHGVILEKPFQIAHRGRCHLLLLPPGESFPAYLTLLEQSAPLQKVPQIFRQVSS